MHDLLNKKFGRLTVMLREPDYTAGRIYWRCRCDCGQWTHVSTNKLTSGNTKSCGCLAQELRGKSRITHGETRGHRSTWSARSKMWYAAKSRAKKIGLPFNITLEDIHVPEVCPVLGIPLAKSANSCQPNSPSIDRVIPEKGYIRGNVQVISHKANTIKNNATVEELERVLMYLQEF